MAEKKSGVGEARFALILTGEQVPMDEAETLLELKPTRVIRKGEIINRLPEIAAATDEWVHGIPLYHPMDEEPELNELLGHLCQRKAALGRLRARCGVTLRLYVQSDYAQMTYQLVPETLQRLVELGLPLEVSSLSWGETGI